MTQRERSRHISRAVRREVYQRDGGRCTYVSADGRRFTERVVELHHLQPFAMGGRHTVENIALTCRCHNGLQADDDFGPDYMAARRASGSPQG